MSFRLSCGCGCFRRLAERCLGFADLVLMSREHAAHVAGEHPFTERQQLLVGFGIGEVQSVRTSAESADWEASSSTN
jgi:hypothetical protein